MLNNCSEMLRLPQTLIQALNYAGNNTSHRSCSSAYPLLDSGMLTWLSWRRGAASLTRITIGIGIGSRRASSLCLPSRPSGRRSSFETSAVVGSSDLPGGGGAPSGLAIPKSVADAVFKEDPRFVLAKRRAAVLICLFSDETGDYRVILTKRAASLSSYAGEVALPGGKRDKEDEDDAATALREAKEEIGLDPSLVKIVTFLEPFLSKNLLQVAPVVGILLDKVEFNPILNPGEVDAIFYAPLEMFLKDENHRYEERSWRGCNYRVHFFHYLHMNGQSFSIWGLTAAILIRSASFIYQRSPAFVEETKPKFSCPHDPKL